MHNSILDKLKTQHQVSEHLVINNTFFNRLSTIVALATTSRFYPRDGVCVPVSKRKIVKTGPTVHLTEAATMKFLAENTSIPVPKVYCSFIRKNRAHIIMERIKGQSLTKSWRALSEESRDRVLLHLRQIIRELRTLRSPGIGV